MRRNRQDIFNSNRPIDIMAEPNIQQLQQVIEQNQREIETLRQQLTQQNGVPQFQLTADQVLNRFHHIKTFTGKGEYTLQEFIHAVENTASLCGGNIPLMQYGLQTVFTEKIQGEAKRCIQRLGNNLTWEQVKAELKAELRPRKSYKRFFDECRNIKVNNLKELFSIIRSINYQLNELYEFDDNKPTNYNPENNDKNLVDIIKDMLTGSYRTSIKQNITINEVFNTFDALGLLEEHDVIHYRYRKNNHKNHRSNNQPKQFNNSRNNEHFNNRVKNNQNDRSGNFRHDVNTKNNRNLIDRSSGQYRRNDNFGPTRFNNGHNSNNNSPTGIFGQRNYQTHNTDNNVTPMEIDNIQQEDVNFSDEPR